MILTPYRNNIFSNRSSGGFNPSLYGGLHYWSDAEQTDIGTTITRADQIGSLNMANPTVGSEPDVNGKYLTYDGIAHYLTNAAANFRSGDSTGVVTVKFKATDNTAATSNILFAVSNSANDTEYFSLLYRELKVRVALVTLGAVVYSLEFPTPIVLDSINTYSVFSNGSTVKFCLNGVIGTFTTLAGVNAGEWITDLGATTNINIATILRPAQLFGKSDINEVLYSSYTDEQTIIDLHNAI